MALGIIATHLAGRALRLGDRDGPGAHPGGDGPAAVIVTALGFDFLWQRLTGAAFLDAATSRTVVASFDPLGSGTIFFAALTGVLLWLSSLAAGWFENWVVYRRLPEAIEHHRYGKRFGRHRMAKMARFLEREAAARRDPAALTCRGQEVAGPQASLASTSSIGARLFHDARSIGHVHG
jgi:hypothetical protein